MADAIARLIELDQAHPKRILVIGDVIDDLWVHGELGECQDGCPKFVEKSRVRTPGGAANAARQLDRWNSGAPSWLYAQAFVPPSSTKIRYICDGKIVFRNDVEGAPNKLHLEQCRHVIMGALPKCHAVLISDYDKGFLTPEFIRSVISQCHYLTKCIPVVADAKRRAEVYSGAVIKANEEWRIRNLGMYHGNALITRGAKPPVKINSDWVLEDNLPLVTCVNHVGAGDCFAAHLTLALAHGLTLEEAATIAHSAGRVYVQRPHGKPPTPQEILEDMRG